MSGLEPVNDPAAQAAFLDVMQWFLWGCAAGLSGVIVVLIYLAIDFGDKHGRNPDTRAPD